MHSTANEYERKRRYRFYNFAIISIIIIKFVNQADLENSWEIVVTDSPGRFHDI